MDLLALAAFEQIADHGGVGRASRAIGQPKTTLSRRLRELEEQLGIRLVERGPKVFHLTEEGVALHTRTRHLLAEIEEAGQAVAGGLSQPRGRLRVSVPGLFADIHMGRIAAEFLTCYPEVDLQVVSDDRMVDPLVEGIDLVVRVNPHPQANLVGRPILREKMLLVASASLARPKGGQVEETAAVVPAVILPTTPEMPPWRVQTDQGAETFVPKPILRLSSVLMAWNAVRCGAGVGVLPESVVESDLRAGRLVSWGRLLDREVEIWVLHTSRRLRSPKVAAFVDALCAAFPNQRIPPGLL